MATKLMLWFRLLTLSYCVHSLPIEDSTKDKVSAQKKIDFNGGPYSDFVSTLQSMVERDISLKRPQYRRLGDEDEPLVWSFFIRPRDLEALMDAREKNAFNMERFARGFEKKDSSSGSKKTRLLTWIMNSIRKENSKKEGSKQISKRSTSDSSGPAPGSNGPAVLYLPLGGGGVNECQPSGCDEGDETTFENLGQI